MRPFRTFSFVAFGINLLTRFILYVVIFFVRLGEFTNNSFLVFVRFIRGHVRVVYYVIRYIGATISHGAQMCAQHCIRHLQNRTHTIRNAFQKVLHTMSETRSMTVFRSTTMWSYPRKVRLHDNHFVFRMRIVMVKDTLGGMCRKGIIWLNRVLSGSVRYVLSVPNRVTSRLKGVMSRISEKTKITKVNPSIETHVSSGDKRISDKTKTIKRKYMYLRISFIFCIGCLLLFFTYNVYSFYNALPKPQDIGTVNFALSTHLYDRNGKALFDFYKDQQRTPVRLKDLPPYVSQATIAIEDKDFYRHNGISLVSGIARAFRDTFFRNQGVQGGSTITQQLVKTALLTPERTITRKLKEAIIALETERVYSKDEILEMYLNQVPFGGSAYGIEEASKKFFGKDAKSLTLSEAALLAGLPQAPTNYSPFTNQKVAKARRDQVLNAMREQGYIEEKEYEHAINEPLNIVLDKIAIEAPHFVFYVREQLDTYFDSSDLYQGGYRIHTTLDLDVQKKASQILKEELEKVRSLNVTNGAILVTKPSTGEILAMVGSVDYFDGKSGEYNVTTALRQPGSSIKPIMYAYALERGYTASTIIDDSPIVFQSGGYEAYRPVNYDGKFHGRVTLRNALANSYNIPAVKVMNRIGVEDFLSYANLLGIETWKDPSQYGLSLALGGGDVTMIDMARAYSVLANEGKRTDIVSVRYVINKRGQILKQEEKSPYQIIDPAYAYIISDILSDNQARTQAFGYGSLLEIPGYKVAVKTGTTDEKRDNWTIGYTPDYLVLVWVGNNNHSPMNPYLTSGVTGAAPIWNRVMRYLLEEKGKDTKHWYERPDNVVLKQCYGKTESFVQGTESTVPCSFPTLTPTSTP